MSMNKCLLDYKTLIFDCDGVVLDSNQVKTSAFYKSALPYGKEAAEAMVNYHVTNGGISRYKKFTHFIQQIVPAVAPFSNGPNFEELLHSYAKEVRQGLLVCNSASNLRMLRDETSHARWLIVSGGDQAELRDVFTVRGLSDLFDGGIYGSPDTKDEILRRELGSDNIQQPALFIGDSKYDYQAAKGAGLDFVFMSAWSEISNWSNWVRQNNISCYKYLNNLVRD